MKRGKVTVHDSCSTPPARHTRRLPRPFHGCVLQTSVSGAQAEPVSSWNSVAAKAMTWSLDPCYWRHRTGVLQTQ